jgi:hypothetical protein
VGKKYIYIYDIIFLNTLHIMLEIKGNHGCDNAEYLWLGYDTQPDGNLVSKEGAVFFTLKKDLTFL